MGIVQEKYQFEVTQPAMPFLFYISKCRDGLFFSNLCTMYLISRKKEWLNLFQCISSMLDENYIQQQFHIPVSVKGSKGRGLIQKYLTQVCKFVLVYNTMYIGILSPKCFYSVLLHTVNVQVSEIYCKAKVVRNMQI